MRKAAQTRSQSTTAGGVPRRALGFVSTVILLFALVPAVAASGTDEEFEIVIPVDTVIHAPVGSTTILSSTPTPEELVGATCTVSATADNQASVHPNNDLVIESETSVVVSDVEAVPGGTVTAVDTIVLSDEIVIYLVMGPDETFSAGLEVGFDCGEVGSGSTTSTTVEETTTTAEVSGTDVTTTSQATSTTVEVLGTVVTAAGEAEVGSTGVLPFTGSQMSHLVLLGIALLLLGVMVVLSGREATADTEEI